MCEESNVNDDTLKLENPIKYYLKNFDDEEIMAELRWEDPELYQKILRIVEIDGMKNKQQIYRCPECEKNIITDEWGEEYCSNCGLVTRAHYPYVAGQRINLVFGLK